MIADSKIYMDSINPDLRGLTISATIGINEQCSEMAAKGKMVFNLGLGQSPFPVPEFVVEALRHHAQQKMYLPVKGLPALREAIAEFHSKRALSASYITSLHKPLPDGFFSNWCCRIIESVNRIAEWMKN